MRIAIAGGTGFIGSALRTELEAAGHSCLILSRSRSAASVYWNPLAGEIDAEQLIGVDAVVNLAGRDIACRWSRSVREEIRSSRIASTALLARTLAAMPQPPRVLINASGISYYGTHPQGEVTERAPLGDGFLAEVCRDWEQACLPASAAGIRTVRLRIGLVLDAGAGALKKMLPPFKAGLGGPVGDGHQWLSWIALSDLTGIIRFCIKSDQLEGALNGVAPTAVTNATFTTTLAEVLHRPAVMRVPALALKLTFGQMAEETVLASARVSAKKVLEAGYSFLFPSLEPALRHTLGKC